MLIYDPKSEVLPIVTGLSPPGTKIDLFHVGDRRTKGWKVSDTVVDHDTADSASTTLCPPNPKASQPFFDNAGRNLMSGCMVSYVHHTPNDWYVRDLILALRRRARLEAVLGRSEEGRELLKGYLSKDSTALDVLSQLMNATNPYLSVAAAFHEATDQVSLRDWVKGDEEGILVLGRDARREPACLALNQVLFDEIQKLLLTPPWPKGETWIVLDEVAVGKFPPASLRNLAEMGRGLGVRLVITCLGLDSMVEAYGENTTHDVLSHLQNIALLRNISPRTVEYAAKLLGKYERKRKQRSTQHGEGRESYSITEVLEVVDSLLGSELQTVPVASRLHGFQGMYVNELGAWWAHHTPEMIRERLGKPADVKAFDPRTEPLWLQPWNEADLRRLRLPLSLLGLEERDEEKVADEARRRSPSDLRVRLYAEMLRDELVTRRQPKRKRKA
jgi:type IV secretory pathway TraG/TraD family ATPase VirD4